MTFGDIVTRFFYEAVPAMAVTPALKFEAVSNAVFGTKQLRYGPLPPPEVQVAVRDVLRAGGKDVQFFLPWGVTKQVPGGKLDVLEFMALRQLACLRDTLAKFGVTAAFYFRIDDNADRWLLGDDRVPDIAEYTDTFTKLVKAVLPENSFTRPESRYASYELFQRTAADLTPVFYRVITGAADVGTLAEIGWKGGLPPEQLDYYYAAYRRFYPGQDHQHIAAKYFASALTRHKLNATTAPAGPRIDISFAKPVPGHPLAGSRVFYRTIPERFTHQHTAPWTGQGYMAVGEDGTCAPRFVDDAAAGRLVPHTVTVGEAKVYAPYLET